MAIVDADSRLFEIGRDNLRPLQEYLRERDNTIPRTPVPTGILTTRSALLTPLREDVIAWTYPDPLVDPDGFLVYVAVGSTQFPSTTAVKISGAQRSHGILVPEQAVMSYALAAYRYGHNGELRSDVVQSVQWVGVV